MAAVLREPVAAAGRLLTLHPGDVALGTRGDRLETLLGSCVSILLTDPRRTVGAMCHIVHARPGAGPTAGTGAFAEIAWRLMHERLIGCGISPRQCEAYVYGGGNMFPEIFPRVNVGSENVRWALETLQREGVSLLDSDVGGSTYRRVSWTVGDEAPRLARVDL